MNYSAEPRKGVHKTWYLSAGQTLENTSISDRGRALVCNQDAWKDINKHLTRKKELQEAIDRENALKEYLRLGSYNMTKDWDNSVQNMRKKRLEAMEGRKAKKEEEYAKQFNAMLKENADEHAKYLEKVNLELFYDSTYPKELHSALTLTEVLYERDAQVKFNKFLQGIEQEREDEITAPIREITKNYRQELLDNKKKEQENKAKLKVVKLAELQEREEARKKEEEEERTNQYLDLENMKRELVEMQEAEKHALGFKKHKMRVLTMESKREKQEYLDKQKEISEQEDRIIDEFNKTKCKIITTSQQKEQESKKMKEERSRILGEKVAALIGNAANDEAERIKRVTEERDAQEKHRVEMDEEKRRKMKEEMQENHRQYLEDEKKRSDNEAELQKWAMLNRNKKEEMDAIYEKGLKQAAINKKKAVFKDLMSQMDENQKQRDLELALDREDFETVKACLASGDKQYIEYAEALIEEMKEKGRNTYPMETTLAQFKMKWGYVKKPDRELRKAKSKNQGHMPYKPEEDPTYARCGCCKDYLIK